MDETWREEYRLYARLPVFARRVERAKAIIAEALARTDVSWLVACSFGKDSLSMLDLILEQRPDITVFHMDSGYCLPELYEVRDWFAQERGIRLHIKPGEMDYVTFLREFGLPAITRTAAQQQRVVQRFKKSASEQWAFDRGFNGTFLGLRREESRDRDVSLRLRSPIYRMKSDMWKCCPLADWTGKDVWAYIVSRNLPYPRFYDYTALGDTREKIRSTSWVTTDGAEWGRIVWLKYYYPALYQKLAREFPEVTRYA
ncbi:MAG: phosphoadenosine phosphosulfate reductase family protein [Bacillota bacterium]|nr:phosphoadenosine phosphosulfate reductase family protein [Bacillota bacterium]